MNTNYFFNTPQRIASLAVIAKSWEGTPFMPNAAVKGAGVSCQKLVGHILIEAGALPVDFPLPEEPMSWGNAHTDSLFEKFMDERSEQFAPVPPPAWPNARPGDVLGIQNGGCVHHCGLVLDAAGSFVHCIRLHNTSPRHAGLSGVMTSSLLEPVFRRMVKRIWRPLQTAAGAN